MNKLTQQNISAKVGISQGYLSSILAGKENPTTRVIKGLASEIGVSPALFLSAEGLKKIKAKFKKQSTPR